MKPDRILCCVLGCRRTAPRKKFPDAAEIICGKCWRQTDKRLRRRYQRLRRIPEARWNAFLTVLWDLNWQRLKVSAAEAKVGIR
jgi:hypothetical protein